MALRRNKAAHCAYAIVGDDMVRWTARDGQITRDVLPVAANDVQREVDKLEDAIASSGASSQAPQVRRAYPSLNHVLPAS